MYTEEEAKKLWCPFARVMNAKGDGGGNRWDNTVPEATCPNGGLCIASNCAVWRWTGDCDERPTDEKCPTCGGSGVVITGSGEYAGGDDCPECGTAGVVMELVGLGYCGLAGKPE